MSRGTIEKVIKRDVVVIGGGVAGMTTALGVAPLTAALITKRELGGGSSSQLAQGGIAVALGGEDSPVLHARDTLEVGCGLSDESAVHVITRAGPELIEELVQLGARFDRDSSGRISLGREAAHSRRRIIHSNGDATGAELVRVLADAVKASRRVDLLEGYFAVDLVVKGDRVAGALVRDPEDRSMLIQAGAVVLATGGIGSLFSFSTNPPEATGDGIAMAARAGARLVDLEFVQFHPTAMAVPSSPLPLLTEALRGEGAVLIDGQGRRFMLEEHPLAELAPRDVVARAIWRKRCGGEEVCLDAREAVGDRFPERFPTVFELCRSHALDPRLQPIPVVPAAHYHIGGVDTDLRGRCSLPGLWACGEVAATGVHGANRLASNSLLEAIVFGRQVAANIKESWHPRQLIAKLGDAGPNIARRGDSETMRSRLRALMWEKVGLVREAGSLESALEELSRMEMEHGPGRDELGNMIRVAQLIARSALMRQESRGVHFRADYPAADPFWARRLYVPEQSAPVAKAHAR